jgi:hypothetical protein
MCEALGSISRKERDRERKKERETERKKERERERERDRERNKERKKLSDLVGLTRVITIFSSPFPSIFSVYHPMDHFSLIELSATIMIL